MREWIVRGCFANFSRERERLISSHETKPTAATGKELKVAVNIVHAVARRASCMSSNWERIESPAPGRQPTDSQRLAATGKELKELIGKFVLVNYESVAATGKELKAGYRTATQTRSAGSAATGKELKGLALKSSRIC
jgi:hypothetical protein